MSFDGRTAGVTRRRWIPFIGRAGFNHGLRGRQDVGSSGHKKTFSMKKIACSR